jgi:hypothetical protein
MNLRQTRRPLSDAGGTAGILLLFPLAALACPVCDTATGHAVRAGIFGSDFGPNLLVTVLPFLVFTAIAAAIYYGPPPRRKAPKADHSRLTEVPAATTQTRTPPARHEETS